MIAAMKQSLLTRAGLALGIVQPVPATPVPQLDSHTVAHSRAARSDVRSLDAVYRALFIIETACKQLSVDVWKNGKQITPPPIVRQPDIATTQKSFIAGTVNSLAQVGNAYWIKHYNERQDVYNVTLANPTDVLIEKDAHGAITYRYLSRTLPASRIIHLRLTHQPGDEYGLSPIRACMETLTGALELRHYADNWLDNPGTPRGLLTTEQTLTSEQAETMKQRANDALTQRSGVAVFGQGLTYKPLLLTPQELQFLDSHNANVVSIARMFGIPARLMLASPPGGSQTYANLEQDELTFLRYTLMAYLSEIESAFDQLTPHGQTVRFNLDALLRTDTKTRYEAHQIGINSGFLTVAEVREIEGLPTQENEE